MKKNETKAIWLSNSIRKHYSYLIVSTVVIAVVVGRFAPTATKWLSPYMLYMIGVMIWAMSVTIRFSDLSLTLKKGRLIACGLATNFIFLPLLCYVLAVSLMSEYPVYAAGFILMGTVPCAGMSVVWTGLLKGDVALALLFDALTMILAIVTIPSLTGLLAGAYVSVSIPSMLVTLAVALIVPIAFGIFTRNLIEKRGSYESHFPIFRSVAALTAMVLMFIMVSVNVPTVPGTARALLVLLVPPLILFPIAFGGIHIFCSKVLKCAQQQTIAIVYSSGMKHLPLAMGVAFVSLGQEAALPIAVAAVFQTLNASLFYRIFQRSSARRREGCGP